MRKTTVRLAAAGALTVAALGTGIGAAAAETAYAPATPTPSTPAVTPSVSPSTGGSGTPSSSTPRTSTPGAVAGSSDELAYTGADVLPWAAAGTVLVLGGTAMVVAARRKPGRSH
ncbi:hypothetical protein GTQ99_07010 [Kineococcus sp. T13]|uniref:hypothetical protein n=1 Tax=Kineococcus vitellinus TaxID=2696565 RepID=UPI0014135DCC|nr:hypothetical protein [Kineococcus vitellinus]NAZ75173.1 hypothetical protein [Kineococcus vitellinus]